jgi:hypothetical protein
VHDKRRRFRESKPTGIISFLPKILRSRIQTCRKRKVCLAFLHYPVNLNPHVTCRHPTEIHFALTIDNYLIPHTNETLVLIDKYTSVLAIALHCKAVWRLSMMESNSCHLLGAHLWPWKKYGCRRLSAGMRPHACYTNLDVNLSFLK